MTFISKDYIFKIINGRLTFIGNFDEYYKNENDPWNQSGEDERLKNYYKYSRKKIIDNIKNLKNINDILEIGCGNGHVSNLIQKNTNVNVVGMDISETAINNAKFLFNNCEFRIGNIRDPNLLIKKKYDVVLLCEVLWYVLEDLQTTFFNINKFLKKDGYIIVNHGFLKNQRYGRNKIDGFNGLIRYLLSNNFNEYKLIKSEILYNKFPLDNGLIILKRNNFE